MNAFLGWIGLGLAGCLMAALPVWEEGEREAMAEEGRVPGEFFAMLLVDDDGEPLFPEVPLAEAGPGATEVPQAEEVPEAFLEAYFGARPDGYLIDPQGLLEREDFDKQLGFLEYHAGDSLVDLVVYLFGGGQEIPGEVREEELIERLFAEGRPAVVVYYHLGDPARTVMYLSPVLTDPVPAAEQRRALESAVMMAMRQESPVAQLDAFSRQLSTRVFWIERMVGDAWPVASGALQGVPLADAGPADAGPVAATAALEGGRLAGGWSVGPWVAPAVGGAAVLAAGCGVLVGLRRRVRREFPEIEVESRLGGAHAAGIGAVISFASATVPPSSQRDQVPDYLRRA